MTAAEIYRRWFEENLPAGLKKLSETPLPDWYTKDMPLVVTYPVRGRHDMDIMEPNTLFPYNNVLPYIDEFAEKTGMKIMVLLMHWEGTARGRRRMSGLRSAERRCSVTSRRSFIVAATSSAYIAAGSTSRRSPILTTSICGRRSGKRI